MLKIDEKLFCENCFNECEKFPCPHCGFNGNDEKRDAMALPYSTVLQGKYVIGKMLGKGGFGITYLALDYQKKTRVAIKEYYPSGIAYRNPGDTNVGCPPAKEESFRDGEEKFYSEAKTIANLSGNDNIVTVYEFFRENNTSYFVMEYLEGCDLKSFIVKNGMLSEGQAITVISSVCSALGDVHEKGVLHRDISPDNIFVCNDGRVVLVDFGAARQLAAEKSQSMSVILKQGFAPIEQYQRKSNHGPWSDIYALGASICFSLTGQLPDDAITRMSSPEIDFSRNRSLSESFKNIISKMMAVNTSDRYTDSNEVMADINALETEPRSLIVKVEPTIKTLVLPVEEKKVESYIPKSEDFGKKTEPENEKKEKKEEKEKKIKPLPFIIGGAVLAVLIVVIILLAKGCSDDTPSDGGAGTQSDIPQTSVTAPADDETGDTEETVPETDAETIDLSKYMQTVGMSSVNNPAYGIVKCDKETAELDSQVILTAVPNAGYKFIGWTDGEMTPERTVMANYESFFVAQFEPMTLTVSFNEGNAAPISVTFGEMYGQLPTPTRANSIFVGWFDAPTGGNMVTSGSTVTNASDHTLYARYDAVVLSYLRITSTNHKTSYIVGEKIDTSNLKLTAVYSDGSEKNVTGFMTNPVNGTAVTQSMNKITVSYEGKTLEYGISVASEAATKVEVISSPSKTTYFEGDRFNTSGLSVKVTYNNGRSETITSGFATTPSNGAVLAMSNTSVTVSYGGKTTSFAITVKKVEPSSITIANPPSPTTYFEGDKLNTAGLSIKVTYNNGTSETLYSGFTTNPANNTALSTSNTQLTVTYQGKTATQNITVKQVVVSSISVLQKPKSEYYENDKLSTSGLKINVVYNNGTTKTITSGFTTNPASGTTLPPSAKSVSVMYEGKTTSYSIKVTPLEVVNISITSIPSKTSYYEGDKLSTSGLKIEAKYNNGTIKTITSGFTTSPSNGASLKSSDNKVTVTYGGATTSYGISVEPLTVVSISIASEPSKTLYYVDDTLSTAGLKIEAKYNNGTTKSITSGFTTNPANGTVLKNSVSVTVSYGGQTASFPITVLPVNANGLSIASLPSKTTYFEGDKLNISGLSLKIAYNNGTSKTVSSGFTTNPADGAILSTSNDKVTVTYEGQTVSFGISVESLNVTSISVSNAPNKTAYYAGDALTTSGLKINVSYNNGTTKTITSGFTTSPSNGTILSTSNNKVTVTYEGVTTSYGISVEPLTAVSISVANAPNKTSYYSGDALTTSGLKINVSYNNGTTKTITSGFTTTPANGATLSASNTKVTVSYEGLTTVYSISVEPVSVTSISISSKPSKTSYIEGDSLSTSGLKINVNYNNGTTKTISSGFSTSPSNGTILSQSNNKVTVTYGGYSISFAIQVASKYVALKNAKVGDIITFGTYEQDNNFQNGKEEIEWIVLDKQGDQIFVITKYAIDFVSYHSSTADITWAECASRKWLNEEFYGTAFDSSQKALIKTTKVVTPDNTEHGTKGGADTYDKLFFLSVDEAKKYFNTDAKRVAKPTPYAVSKGLMVDEENGNTWWWLRSPGILQLFACNVMTDGSIYYLSFDVLISHGAARPAMWIDLSSL